MVCTLDDIIPLQEFKCNMNVFEMNSLGSTSTRNAESLKKELASFRIIRLYRALTTEFWMNEVISAVIRKHPFSNRLEISNCPIRTLKPGGIMNLHRHFKKTKHIILYDATCGCGRGIITKARYYSIGMKARCSTPHLEFYCDNCPSDDEEEEEYWTFFDGEYYQFPQYTTKPEVHWQRC